MAYPTEEQIRSRAHQLWEQAGKPEGREDEFWRLAEQELLNEDKSSPVRTPDNLWAASVPVPNDMPIFALLARRQKVRPLWPNLPGELCIALFSSPACQHRQWWTAWWRCQSWYDWGCIPMHPVPWI